MAIFERISRILKANINRVIDLVEPAEKELEAGIQELGEVIHEGRESAAMYGVAYKKLVTDLSDTEKRRDTLAIDAEAAVLAGDETHARRLLGEKVKAEEKIAQLKPRVEEGRKSYEMLTGNIQKLQEQLAEAKMKLHNLRARKDIAEAQNAFEKKLGRSGISEPGFDRLEEEVLAGESEVEVRREMRGDSLSDLDLQERTRELQVEAQLQALREKLEKK